LILQEAQKKNITVSQQEINDQIKTIEKNISASGQTLDQALAAQHMTKQDLDEQIKVQKIAEKMFAKDAVVTDAQAQKYVADNPTLFTQSTDAEKIAAAKQQWSQQKLQEKFQAWLQKIQQSAKIQYFVNYP